MNIKEAQNFFESVLSVKASVFQPAFFLIPIRKPAIIERLFGIFYNERNDIKPEALFQHYQSADSAVSVLERVNIFKFGVKCDNVVDRYIVF